MNVIAIVGLETIKDEHGNIKVFSETFLNNIKTYKKDNPGRTLNIFDARIYKEFESPIKSLWKDMAEVYGVEGIDLILYSGHSDSERLYWVSKTRTELADEDRFIDANNEWNFKFNKSAKIQLMGCQTGGQRGQKWPNCIAQSIADKSGVEVLAFVSKSAQQKKKNGYYQIPDYNGYVKFTPNEVVKEII